MIAATGSRGRRATSKCTTHPAEPKRIALADTGFTIKETEIRKVMIPENLARLPNEPLLPKLVLQIRVLAAMGDKPYRIHSGII